VDKSLKRAVIGALILQAIVAYLLLHFGWQTGNGYLMRISQWSKVDTNWYLGVRCHKCETPILFALDRGGAAVEPGRAGKLVLTCSLAECRHQSDYSTAAVSRFQKQPAVLNETRS